MLYLVAKNPQLLHIIPKERTKQPCSIKKDGDWFSTIYSFIC